MNKHIVCAANMHRVTGEIVIGIRHWDTIMRNTVKRGNHGGWDISWSSAKQGFIDQFGTFYDRQAAWLIAEKNGQIKRTTGKEGTLYSEDLY